MQRLIVADASDIFLECHANMHVLSEPVSRGHTLCPLLLQNVCAKADDL